MLISNGVGLKAVDPITMNSMSWCFDGDDLYLLVALELGVDCCDGGYAEVHMEGESMLWGHGLGDIRQVHVILSEVDTAHL